MWRRRSGGDGEYENEKPERVRKRQIVIRERYWVAHSMDQPSTSDFFTAGAEEQFFAASEGGDVSSPQAARPVNDGVGAPAAVKDDGKRVAKEYFQGTLGEPRFIARWRRRYGDASADIEHVAAGIYLGGVHQYIDDARVELVDSGRMSEVRFCHWFSTGRIAKRIHNAALQESTAPRGSQLSKCADAGGTQKDCPLPKKYLNMSREKQRILIEFARGRRDKTESERTFGRKMSRVIRDADNEYAELHARYMTIGKHVVPANVDEVRAVWDTLCGYVKVLRERREAHYSANENNAGSSVDSALEKFEELYRDIVNNWKDVDFVNNGTWTPREDDIENVIPVSATQGRESLSGKNNRYVQPEDIQNKANSAAKCLRSVEANLDRWHALYRKELSQTKAGPENDDDRFHRIVDKMKELATEMDDYFREKPLPRRLCVAAFSSTPGPHTKVRIVGTVPETYQESVRALLHSIVGAGHQRKVDVDSKTKRLEREMRKETYTVTTNEHEELE